MANEKLIQNMMKCDGRKLNCDECIFKNHPACRNAMARHAGAMINLQEVVLENQAAVVHNLEAGKKEMENFARTQGKVMKELGEILDGVAADLCQQRHCPTCEHWTPEDEDMSEVCAQCSAEGSESQWELAKRYYPENKQKTEEKSEGEDGDELTKVE